jgi:hypothetical protein
MKRVQTPAITKKQREILDLLYRYRFLTRLQIQALLKHKDKKTINLWLRELRAKDYTKWIYDKDDFARKTKPAIYYLGINGIRHLRNIDSHADEALRIRYREHERSQTFIDRCLAIADCCLDLEAACDESSLPRTWYFYETEADYLDDSYYHFLADSELIHPYLCFSKRQDAELGESGTTQSYLLEIFEATLPRYRLRNRLKKYVEYFDEEAGTWDEATAGDPLPIVLLVCASATDLIYSKRRTRGLMADIWEYNDDERPHLRFTTIEKIKEQGVLGGIWEEA